MRSIPYTSIQIDSDPRIPVAKKIIREIVGQVALEKTIVTIMPDNNMISIFDYTLVNVVNLKECIPGYTIFIDQDTFNAEVAERYHLKEDEYILFNQNTSSIYLNIVDTNQRYFYNLGNYPLIDKIEDITSYDDFQYYLSLKSDDGSKFFSGFSDKFIIPIFTKFPNINKADLANLYVYKLDAESFIVVWQVKKKKLGRDVYSIYRVLDLT